MEVVRKKISDLPLAFNLKQTLGLNPGGVHKMLMVRVCAAHMGGVLAQNSRNKGSLSRRIFLQHGWIFQKLTKK